MMLPPKFVQDPGTYLAEVASMPPSLAGMAALAGPVAGWFTTSLNPFSNVVDAFHSDDSTAPDAPQRGMASVYLQAAAVQLRDTDVKLGNVDAEMIRTKQQYEVLEVSDIYVYLVISIYTYKERERERCGTIQTI
jgi:hypothetical protein